MENSTPPAPTGDVKTVTFPPLAGNDTSDTPPPPFLKSFGPPFFLMLFGVGPSREDSAPPTDLHCDSPRRVWPAANLPISQERVDKKKATPPFCAAICQATPCALKVASAPTGPRCKC